MGAVVIGIIMILALCYVGEGRTHPELEGHDWYRG